MYYKRLDENRKYYTVFIYFFIFSVYLYFSVRVIINSFYA